MIPTAAPVPDLLVSTTHHFMPTGGAFYGGIYSWAYSAYTLVYQHILLQSGFTWAIAVGLGVIGSIAIYKVVQKRNA